MNIEFLVIDNYPKIDTEKMTITTEYPINSNEEISISINNSNILNKDAIYDIVNNTIELIPDIEINKDDIIIVIYNKVGI